METIQVTVSVVRLL